MMNLLSFCFILFFTLNLQAKDIICNKQNIYSVEAKVSVDQPELGTYQYYYQYIKKADPSVPTIIVIPGGPGGKSIDLSSESPYFDWIQLLYGFPEKYNAILTDPRSIGCNQVNKNLPIDSFTTENVAHDIVTIIKKLNLDNYVIYGHSYGTVVATFLGKIANDGIIPKPKAIILSGTIGHYFTNHKQEVMPAYYESWKNLRSLLPKKIQESFPQNDDWSDFENDPSRTMPLGLSVASWANFIFDNLTEGGSYLNGQLVYPLLTKLLLLNSNNESELEKLKIEVSTYTNETDETNPLLKLKPFHDSIWCKELEETKSPECLAQDFEFNNPYDSKFFQIKDVPVIYIHGQFDPSVPIKKAFYHFKNQLNENKYFLLALNGGHATTMVITDCKDLFWKSIFEKSTSLEEAIGSCLGVKLINPT